MLFDHIAAGREVSKTCRSQRFSTARGACGKIPRNGIALAACHSGQPESRHPTHHGPRAMYQSDITQFLNQLKQQKASRVEQTPYSYYQNF